MMQQLPPKHLMPGYFRPRRRWYKLGTTKGNVLSHIVHLQGSPVSWRSLCLDVYILSSLKGVQGGTAYHWRWRRRAAPIVGEVPGGQVDGTNQPVDLGPDDLQPSNQHVM